MGSMAKTPTSSKKVVDMDLVSRLDILAEMRRTYPSIASSCIVWKHTVETRLYSKFILQHLRGFTSDLHESEHHISRSRWVCSCEYHVSIKRCILSRWVGSRYMSTNPSVTSRSHLHESVYHISMSRWVCSCEYHVSIYCCYSNFVLVVRMHHMG